MDRIKEYNQRIMKLLSLYLNDKPDCITINQINKVCKEGVNDEIAFSLLLQNYFELSSQDQEFIDLYFPLLIKKLDNNEYMSNEYYKNIVFTNKKKKRWEFKISMYKPYEFFVCDDFLYLEDGRVIPQIGFFSKPFYYPAVYENNQLWMSVTPNEINTMKEVISECKNVVCTIGLGLGYFAYMISNKEDVNKVIIIEKDCSVITLFKENVLSQFSHKEKIEIINKDAFEFLDQDINNYHIEYLYSDIWHDVSDGKELYLKIKEYEKRYTEIKFRYWIEKTIKYYL